MVIPVYSSFWARILVPAAVFFGFLQARTAGCPQSTEKVLGVVILAFSQIQSEKGIPFRKNEEFLSMFSRSHLIKVKLAVLRT